LYSLSSLSPPEDKRAIQLYKAIQRELPVAVPARDNPDFWDTVLGAVNQASNLLPGPYKSAAKGVHAIGSAIHNGNKKKGKAPSKARTKGSNGRNRPKKKGKARPKGRR
jgi:hypothetical protein